MVPRTGDCFAPGTTFDQFLSRSTVCVSFVENLSTFEFYLLGALRGALVPTVLLTQNPEYPFNPQIPTEYQARVVTCKDMQGVCQTVQKEIAIFEEDYLDIKDQQRVLRYRAALIQEGTDGKYSRRTRDMVVNIVAQNAGGIDLSKDKIQVSNVVGPVNIKSRLDNVTQTVKNAQSLPDDKRDELTQLLADLKAALEPIESARQDDTERVVRTAELVATEAAKPKPDKGFLDISIEGLKKAAKTVEDIAPTVLTVASRIATFVAGI